MQSITERDGVLCRPRIIDAVFGFVDRAIRKALQPKDSRKMDAGRKPRVELQANELPLVARNSGLGERPFDIAWRAQLIGEVVLRDADHPLADKSIVRVGTRRHQGSEPVPASLIDVAPTVLNSLGLKPPPAMQGRDLNHPEALAGRPLFNEAFPCPVMQPPDCRQGCTARSVYEWPYKYIRTSNGKRELFNLSLDPLEEHTVYAQQRTVADKMRDDLDDWMKLMPARSSQKHTVNRDDLQKLKGLGYIQ